MTKQHHQKITIRHQVIAPHEALSSVTEELYERQRPLKQSFVRQYALAMRQGLFREGTLISYAVWQGRRYLINGQHTLHAIGVSGVPILLAVEEIQVSSYEEIAQWYAKYDRVNNRTLNHAYRAHDLEAHVNMNDSQITQTGACLPLLASGFEPITRASSGIRLYVNNPETRMAFIREWTDEARRYFECIKGAPVAISMNMRSSPVFSVALVTLRCTGTDAETFWRNVVWDDGLVATDPQKHLNYFLRTTQLSRYPSHAYSRYVANAWCHAWNERSIKSLQPQSATTPIRLEGTPHNGKVILRYISPTGQVLSEPIPYEHDNWQQAMFPELPDVSGGSAA